MDHTVLPANNTMPAFPSRRSPDVTTTLTEAADIQLLLTTHLSTRKDERLSWPSWLTYSRWLTHISGHPSATSRAQDSESTSAKGQCSTAGPRNATSSDHRFMHIIHTEACLLVETHLDRRVFSGSVFFNDDDGGRSQRRLMRKQQMTAFDRTATVLTRTLNSISK